MPALSVPLGTDFQSGRINIGSAVAGVVGTSQRSYDVWGDAVKMHRHVQSGALGLVMSPPAGAALHGHRDVEPLGMTDLRSQALTEIRRHAHTPGATG